MKRCLIIAALALTLVLCGCPNTQQQTQIAQAALTASSTLVAAQAGEITMYNQGKLCQGQPSCISISTADHQFIQEQFHTAGTLVKTLDSCIRTSSTNQGAAACVSTAANSFDQIYTSGGTYIKSDEARKDFEAAISATKLALTVLAQAFGGTAK